MAMTIRLPDGLKAQANILARELGISINALVAVALRDYLDARSVPQPDTPPPEVRASASLDRRELLAVQELLGPKP